MPISIPTYILSRNYTNQMISEAMGGAGGNLDDTIYYTVQEVVSDAMQDVALSAGNLPTVDSLDNGKTLIVNNGEWTVDTLNVVNNIEDGSNVGSVRTISSQDNDSNYNIGRYAFAEGELTKASGRASHAECEGTYARGAYSHAEGNSTTASGEDSHAEGNLTTASGNHSHAEGDSTTASGVKSHAEGSGTTAQGANSHAEGRNTVANAPASHAEGTGTIANHSSQHVFGEYNIEDDSNEGATSRGNYIEIVGRGTANNLRRNARTLDWSGNEWLAGNVTVAGGSLTLGNTTFTASTIGTSNLQNLVDGSANGSLKGVNASPDGGTDNYRIGVNSVAEGYNTKANGSNAHAEGSDTRANGDCSHAEGYSTYAYQSYTHSEGYTTTATGSGAHSEGSHTTAGGDFSHSEGSYTRTRGSYAHVEGRYTIANHKSQHVFGEYNIVDPSSNLYTERGTYVEIVGNGADENGRSNARTLDWNGNEWLGGNLSLASGKSFTIGNTTITEGQLQELLALLPQQS